MAVKPEIVLPKGAVLIEEEPQESIVLPKGATLIQDKPVKKKETGGSGLKPSSPLPLPSALASAEAGTIPLSDEKAYSLLEDKRAANRELENLRKEAAQSGVPLNEADVSPFSERINEADRQLLSAGYDPDEIEQIYSGVPMLKGFGISEALQIKKDNPDFFNRKRAAVKYQYDLFNEAKQKFGEEEANSMLNEIIGSQVSQDYNSQRTNTRNIIGQVYKYVDDGDKQKQLINEVIKDRMYGYGVGLQGQEEAINADPRLGALSREQVLGLQMLEDIDPSAANSFNRLLSLTPEERADYEKNTSFKLGYQLKAKELQDIGLNAEQRSLEEKMTDFVNKNKGEQLTPEEQEEYNMLFAKRQEVLEKRDNQKAEFPLAYAADADRLMQDYLGARHGTFAKTLLGIGENADDLINFVANSAPMINAQDGRIDDLEKFGNKQLGQLSQYDTKEEELFGRAYLPVFSGELKDKLDLIKNDNKLTAEQKEDAVRAAIFQDDYKNISYIANDKSGKFNFTGKSILNAVSNVASEIIPQILASYITAGGSNASKLQELGSLFASTYTMSFNDYYTDGINKNIEKPFEYATLHTAIEAATELYGNNIAQAKRLFGGTTAGKLLNKATDEEIEAVTKAGKGYFKNFLDAAGRTAKISEKNARQEAFEELAGAVGGNATDKYMFNQDVALQDNTLKDFVTTYVGMLPLGLLGLPFQMHNVNANQKRALYEAATRPAKYFEKLDENVEAGKMNPNDAFKVKERINNAYTILKEMNVTKADGTLMTDNEKTNYLFNKVVQKDIEDNRKEATTEQQELMDNVNDEVNIENQKIAGNKATEKKQEYKSNFPVTEKPITESTSEEIFGQSKNVRSYLKNQEKEFFGEDGAKKYREAQQVYNSRNATKEEQGEAKKVIDEMEGSLTKEQYDDFFGISRDPNNMYDPEELANLSQKVRLIEEAENVEDLSRSLKLPLLDFSRNQNDIGALTILNSAKKKAEQLGVQPEELIKKSISNIVSELPDKADAELLGKSVLEKLIKPTENVTQQIEQPKEEIVLEEDFEKPIEVSKAKKVSNSLRELSQKIRNTDITGSGGQSAQSDITRVPREVFAFAIERVADAIDAGETVVNAIQKGVDYIREQGHQMEDDSFKSYTTDLIAGKKPRVRVPVQGGETTPLPAEPPTGTAQNQPADEFDNKAIIGRMMASDKVSETSKEQFREAGLKYKVRHQEEARKVANEVVDEYGMNASLVMAESGKFHGDVNSMIFAVSLDRVYAEQEAATTPEDKQDAAERWADIALRYQDAAESGGRFISAINDFYLKSPAGLVIKTEKEFKRRQDEYFKGREKTTKEAFEELINTVEGKELLEEELQKRKPKIFTEDTKKKIKNFFDKFRIDPKDQAGVYLVPPQILNAAIDIIEQAVLAGVSLGKAIEQGVEYIGQNHKEAWKVNEFRKDIKDGYKKQKVERNLTEEDKVKILNKWKKKLTGLTEQQKVELLKKSFIQLIENGALNYDDFKQLYAEAVGLPQMTPDLAAKLTALAKKINEPGKLKEEIQKTKSLELINKYAQVVRDAEKAATDLNELIGKEKWWFNTAISVMRLNTLSITSLLGNVVGNIMNLPFRYVVNFTGTGLDYLLAGAQLASDKAFGSNFYKSKPIPAIFTTQRSFARGGKLGTQQAIDSLFTGMSNRDYFQKEVKQNIRPLESAKKLWKGLTKQEKVSLNGYVNAAIEAFPLGGVSAEGIARVLNVGDKGFRFAAEMAMADKLAQQEGLTGVDKQIFMLFPDEESEAKIRAAGEAIVFQQKNFITKALDRATGAANTVFDEPGLKGVKPVYDVVKGLGYTFQPFLNTPLNVFFEFLHYMFPPLPLIKAGIAMRDGNREAVAHHLAQALVGFAVTAVATQLVANGLIVASGGEDEEAKERAGIQTYQREGQMNISGLKRWMAGGDPSLRDNDVHVDLKYYGLVGMMLLAKGRQYRKSPLGTIEQQNALQDLMGQFAPAWKVGLTEGVFSGTGSLLNAASMGGGYTDQWLLGMANVAENTVDPQWLRQFSLASNEYLRDTKGMSLGETATNQLKQRLFMGEQLPKKINIWGDKIENVPNKQNPYLWYVFAISKANPFDNDKFGYVLYDYYQQTKDYNIFPPMIKREVNGFDLTPKQYEQFSILVGSHRKQLVAAAIEGSNFNDIKTTGHAEVIKYFQSLYDEGRALAVEEFLTIYPQFQKTDY